MKLRDFQQLLRAFSSAIASAKGAIKDLDEAADALTPFAEHSMADFAAFLRLAEKAYRETGQLPTPTPPKRAKPAPKKSSVTEDELRTAVQSVTDRLAQRVPLTRDGVKAELAKFEKLPAPVLEKFATSLGFKNKPKNRKDAIDLIAERLLAGSIADGRSQI